MKPALAIFRKDVRHLWPRIAVVLAVELLIGWLSFSQPAGLGSVRYPLGLVELLAWWYLIASAIHEEAVPGDRQYWLTRPFSKRDLLTSKLIFLLAFTCLPLFLAQVASLLLRGTSPFAYLPDILASQLFFLATTVLPAAALASISAGLVEFVGIALAAWLWSYGLAWMVGWRFRVDYDWGGLNWFRPTLVAALTLAAAAAILLLQYLRQRTWLFRGIVAAVLVITTFLTYMPGWHTAFQLQEGLSPRRVPATAAIISFDPARDTRAPTLIPERWTLLWPNTIPIPIPVRVTGIPPGMALHSDRVAATIGTPNGQRWSSGWDSLNALVRLVGTIHAYNRQGPVFAETEERVLAGEGEYWLYLLVDRSFYRRTRSGPMRLHARLALTLLSPLQTTPLTVRDGPQAVSNDGFCLVQWHNRLLETNCLWPGRLPASLHLHLRPGRIFHPPGQAYAYLTIADEEADRIVSYAPFPTSGGLWQLNSDWHSAEARPLGADLVTRKAVAHFERDLDIPDLRGWTNR